VALEVPEFIPTKSYTFGKLREMVGNLSIQQGAVEETDFQVIQRGAGPNMTVEVKSGDCWIKGEYAARQGMYHLYNSTNASVTIEKASGANPRVDRIIAVINDSSVIGSSDIPELKAVEGVPTSGAQVNEPQAAKYRAGAPSSAEVLAKNPTASGFLTLAYVLVGTSVTEIKTANIADARTPFIRDNWRIALYTHLFVNAVTGMSAIPSGAEFEGGGAVEKYGGAWYPTTHGFEVPFPGTYLVVTGTTCITEALKGLVAGHTINGVDTLPYTASGASTEMSGVTKTGLAICSGGTSNLIGALGQQSSGSTKSIRIDLAITRLGK
jgi:hypothetical protein